MILASLLAMAAWTPTQPSCLAGSVRMLDAAEFSRISGVPASSESGGVVAFSGDRLSFRAVPYGSSGCPMTLSSVSVDRVGGEGGSAFFSDVILEDPALLGPLSDTAMGLGRCEDGKSSSVRFSRGMMRSDGDLLPSSESLEKLSIFSGLVFISHSSECVSIETVEGRGMGASGLSGSAAAADLLSFDFRGTEGDSQLLPWFSLSGLSIFKETGHPSLKLSQVFLSFGDDSLNLSLDGLEVVPSDIVPSSVLSSMGVDPTDIFSASLDVNLLTEVHDKENAPRHVSFSLAAPEFMNASGHANFNATSFDLSGIASGSLSSADLAVQDLGAIKIYESYTGMGVESILDLIPFPAGVIPEEIMASVSGWLSGLEGSTSMVTIAPDSPIFAAQALLAIKFSPVSFSEIVGINVRNDLFVE